MGLAQWQLGLGIGLALTTEPPQQSQLAYFNLPTCTTELTQTKRLC